MDTQHTKRVTALIALTYFFILLSYPLVRSSSSALFYEYYTADDYSFATFIGVIVLMVFIGVSNFLQNRIGIQKLYLGTGIVSIGMLGISYLGLQAGIKEFAYALFATKESYIVVLVHMCLAYANAYYPLDQLKKLIGPIGAVGSIGGIVGGQLTSFLATSMGTEAVFTVSLTLIFTSSLIFYFTQGVFIAGLNQNKLSLTPLRAVQDVKKYVFLIGLVVALSQFVIYIADLQFNMIFEKVVTTKDARASYLGDFYSIINFVSLFLQFVVLPFLLTRVELRSIFIFIPGLYFLLVIGGFSFGATSLIAISSVFIAMKGTDYSLFAATKDVMYHPLLSLQKFGAKYITDMFVYRTAKAIIAFIMAQFTIIEMGLITTLQFLFLGVWILGVIALFEEQKKLNKKVTDQNIIQKRKET